MIAEKPVSNLRDWLKPLFLLLVIAAAAFAFGTGSVSRVLADDSPTVQVLSSPALGPILGDSQGMTLYTFARDTANGGTSAVSGGLATVWPPFVISGQPVSPDGLPGPLGLISRSDGSMQVTYNGMPLYYYANDHAQGDTNGQGIGGVWFVAAP